MKSLTQFIKESQHINEGLLGDIVRKLLDTGLSWIGGSVKWIADKMADSVSGIWKTHKDVLGTVYSDFIHSHPQYTFLPKAPKTAEEAAIGDMDIFLNENIAAEDKIDYANKKINKLKKRKGIPGAVEAFIAQIAAMCYVGIVENKKATSSDKTKADNFLNSVKSSLDDDTKKLIDSSIKHYISEI